MGAKTTLAICAGCLALSRGFVRLLCSRLLASFWVVCFLVLLIFSRGCKKCTACFVTVLLDGLMKASLKKTRHLEGFPLRIASAGLRFGVGSEEYLNDP